jgi:hypothetical protein
MSFEPNQNKEEKEVNYDLKYKLTSTRNTEDDTLSLKWTIIGVLVSIGFIIRGVFFIKSGNTSWGTWLIIFGSLGLLYKIIDHYVSVRDN